MNQIETNTTPLSESSIISHSITFRKDMGLLAAIVFAFNSIGVPLSGLLPYAVMVGLFPGVDLLGIVLAAIAVALVFGTIYSSIGGLIPHNGAEYVLVTRVFGGAFGFSTSFTMVMFLGLSAGAILSMLPRLVLPGMLTAYGLTQGNNVGTLANAIAQPGAAVVVATMMVVLSFGASILPRRLIRIILFVAFAGILMVWLRMLITLAIQPANQFPPAWDAAMGFDSFVSRLKLAETAGLVEYQDPKLIVFGGLAFFLWLFFGSFSLVSVAGEMKKPGRDLPLSHLASTVLVAGLIVVTILLLRKMILPMWFSAESYLFLHGSEVFSMPWVFFYTAIFKGAPAFLMTSILVWVLGFITILQTIFYYAGRIIWAWAKDRIFPVTVSFMHTRWRSPLVATLFFAIFVQLSVVIAMQLPRLFFGRAYIAPLMALMIAPLVAMVVAAFTKPKWFQQASGIAAWRIGRFPIVAILAVVGIVILVVSLFVMINGRLGLQLFTGGEIGLIILFYLIGYAWYAGRRIWLQRSQINLDDTFQQIP